MHAFTALDPLQDLVNIDGVNLRREPKNLVACYLLLSVRASCG